MMLKDKTILLGVTGGLLHIKCHVCQPSVKTGACVHVIIDPECH